MSVEKVLGLRIPHGLEKARARHPHMHQCNKTGSKEAKPSSIVYFLLRPGLLVESASTPG